MADDKKAEDTAKEAMSAIEKWDAKGIEVDKKALEGRKANRGFTISVGKSSTDADDSAATAMRKEKRAQTLPATNLRRGDHILNADSLAKVTQLNEALMARFRRGSVNVAVTIIEDEELILPEKGKAPHKDMIWKEHCYCQTHGIMTQGQSHSDERERAFWESEPNWKKSCPDKFQFPEPIISCQKGSKGFRDTTPNQDNFSVTYFKNGWTVACAFDGHGPFGHIVSHRTVQTVPYFMIKSGCMESDMPEAFKQGFENSQKELVAHALKNEWDVQASGSTAVACAWRVDGNTVTVVSANAGDSRCVVGSETSRKVLYETADHKPNTPAEKERIENSGGEVRTQTYPDGWVNHRIFVKGEDYPGLCMARTLGDQSVKDYGVIATPECETHKVKIDDKDNGIPFILLASDGVWEFLDSDFVVKAVAKKIATDGAKRTVEKLQREAKKRWRAEEGDYCDDITSVLVRVGAGVDAKD